MDSLKLDDMRRANLVAVVLSHLIESRHLVRFSPKEMQRGDKLNAWLEKWVQDGNPEPSEHEFRDVILNMAEEAIREE